MKIMNFGMLPIDLSELSHFSYHFVLNILIKKQSFSLSTGQNDVILRVIHVFNPFHATDLF